VPENAENTRMVSPADISEYECSAENAVASKIKRVQPREQNQIDLLLTPIPHRESLELKEMLLLPATTKERSLCGLSVRVTFRRL